MFNPVFLKSLPTVCHKGIHTTFLQAQTSTLISAIALIQQKGFVPTKTLILTDKNTNSSLK